MKMKRNITACAGALLVLLLGIAMVCGGCKSDNPEWDYTGTAGGNQTTADTTTPPTPGKPTPVGPDEPAPSVDINVVDREELDGPTDGTTAPTVGGTTDTTPPTAPGNTGSTGGNTGSTGGNTGATTPTVPGSTGGNTETTPPTTGGNTNEPELDENGYWTYEYYVSRSGSEQMAYFKTFPSVRAFNDWYNAAKAAYEAAHPKETITDGNIELN